MFHSKTTSFFTPNFTEASKRKVHLAKMHNATPVWKFKEKLLLQAPNTFAKARSGAPLPLQEVGGIHDSQETIALVKMPLIWQLSK